MCVDFHQVYFRRCDCEVNSTYRDKARVAGSVGVWAVGKYADCSAIITVTYPPVFAVVFT